jgi:hypothetical protein
MATLHVLQKGETFAGLAEACLGDRSLAGTLAGYNGLRDTRWATPGQVICIPTLRELQPRRGSPAGARAAGPVRPWPAAPNGLAAIVQTFGNPWDFARDDGTADPRWETTFMARAAFPFPIPLDWDPTKSATGARCHRLVAPLLEAVFADVVAQGLQKAVRTYGGCYNWRMKRGAAKPSTHSWGIAIDLNARWNAMGTAGDMDPRLVALFESYGFAWGGRWSGANKDPMHFQYCSGY